jgi:hypothetical protein
MAFRERTITGTVVDGDGTPVQSGTVSFKPTKTVGYTATHVVIDRIFTATTDSTGLFTITVWCDEDSLVAIDYIVMFPIANNGLADPLHMATISLSYQDGSPKDIGTLIAESLPPPSGVPDSTWAALIDSRIALTLLDQLSDVIIASPTNGQVLTYETSSGKWKNQAAGGGGGTPGGSNTHVQFNNSGAFGGSANFAWLNSVNQLKLTAGAASDNPFLIKLAASQSGDALRIEPNGSATPLVQVVAAGQLKITGGASDGFPQLIQFRNQVYANSAYILWGGGILYLEAGDNDAGGIRFTSDGGSYQPVTVFTGATSPVRLDIDTVNAASTAIKAQLKASHSVDAVKILDNGAIDVFVIDKKGTFGTKVNAAPADADIDANQMFIWFDPTNGASKFKIKAKQADGTVKTGEIALA